MRLEYRVCQEYVTYHMRQENRVCQEYVTYHMLSLIHI